MKKDCKIPNCGSWRELPGTKIVAGAKQLRKALDAGAWCAVVGGAITRPLEIANRFMAAVKDFKA